MYVLHVASIPEVVDPECMLAVVVKGTGLEAFEDLLKNETDIWELYSLACWELKCVQSPLLRDWNNNCKYLASGSMWRALCSLLCVNYPISFSQWPHFEYEHGSSEILTQFPKHTACVAVSGFKSWQCGPVDHAPCLGSPHAGGARALTRPVPSTVPSTRRHCTESQHSP